MTAPLYRKRRDARVQAAREKFNEAQEDYIRAIANEWPCGSMDVVRDAMVSALNELCELADDALYACAAEGIDPR